MNLKTHCLGRLPLTEAQVQQIFDDRMKSDIHIVRTDLYEMALSHERLRAERDGLQLMLDEQLEIKRCRVDPTLPSK